MIAGNAACQPVVEKRGEKQVVQFRVKFFRNRVDVRNMAAKNNGRYFAVAHDEFEEKRLGDVVAGIDDIIILKTLDEFAKSAALEIIRPTQLGLDRFK